MPRRTDRTRPSLFSPAGELLRKLNAADQQERWQQVIVGTVLAIGLFLYASFTGETSAINIAKLEFEKRTLTQANQSRFAEIVDASLKIDRLRSDKTYLEIIARTNYRMVYPNEILYRFKGK